MYTSRFDATHTHDSFSSLLRQVMHIRMLWYRFVGWHHGRRRLSRCAAVHGWRFGWNCRSSSGWLTWKKKKKNS